MKALTLPLSVHPSMGGYARMILDAEGKPIAGANEHFGSAARLDEIVRRVNMHDRLVRVLKALMTNEHVNLGDMVYDVREREGQGWEGPGVVAWSTAVAEAEEVLKQCA